MHNDKNNEFSGTLTILPITSKHIKNKLMEVSWGSCKNRDTMIPPGFIEKLPKGWKIYITESAWEVK
jgi:hypothetical protein